MKTLLLRSLFCFFILNSLMPESIAQPGSKRGKVIMYKAIITTTTGYKMKAWLYDADEVQLYLVSDRTKISSLNALTPTLTLQGDQIQTIRLRRKGSFKRSALLGGLIGFGYVAGVGAIINSGRSGNERVSIGEIASTGCGSRGLWCSDRPSFWIED